MQRLIDLRRKLTVGGERHKDLGRLQADLEILKIEFIEYVDLR